MTDETRRWRWRDWLPDVSAAFARFPLAVILAGALTLFKLSPANSSEAALKLVGTLVASFLWVVAVDLFAESHSSSHDSPRPKRLLAWLAGIGTIALLFRFQWEAWFQPPLLFAALVLAIGLSGQLGKGERNAAFWLFNHRLWLAAALALLGAALFGAGLSIILETLNFLFNFGLPFKWHEHIWTIALGFMAPVSWLALAPRNFSEGVGAKEAAEFTLRAVAGLAKFVLVPLLFVYTAILFAYAVKIGLARTLPRGTLGSMVVGYLLAGAVTLLLAFPSRESGGVLVRLFWRYWVWLAAMPVLLLFLAVFTRIKAYGLTEQRYLIVLIGVWALILAGLRIWRAGSLDLRLVPGVLAVLLFAACFGPWGAIGLSIFSQKAELAGILSAKGLLADGKIVARTGGGEGDNPLGSDAARARGIEWYLNTHHALHQIAPWFAGHDPDPFAPGKTPEQILREVLAGLSLRADIPNSAGVVYFTHYSDMPEAVSLGSGGHVLGPVVFESGGPIPAAIPPRSVSVEGLGTVRLEITDNVLTAAVENGPALRFNIMEAARELANPLSNEHRPLRLNAASDGLSGVLLIDNLNGSYLEPAFTFSLIRFWLVLKRG
jgi:hypothetical protein